VGYVEIYLSYFWLVESKHLPVFKDTAMWICWLPLFCLMERERGKGRGKIHSPSTPAQELLNGIPHADWWRVRERKRKEGKLSFQRE
jgi:hypothetical protein